MGGMEINSTVIDTPPRPAASLVMLRDGQAGLEVFLLKRHGLSDVLGGAYVFPGGKLDAMDRELDRTAHLDLAPEALHQALGEPETDLDTGVGLYVAALREAFEEAGVLLAERAGLELAAQAQALSRQGMAFDEVLAHLGLRLSLRDVVPWSRWITPRMPSVMTKRFDTRFFVTAVPADQVATHDNRETVQSVWLSPRAALEQYWEREIALAPPQIMGLAHLSRHRDVASVLDEARRRLPPLVQPEPFDEAGSRVICYPGDERHPVPERALPGPTRLRHVQGRFEPIDGFDALFE
jgi:8-oxo-dGTP pyrophosphatase MutT (NUDIX family)